MQGKANNPGKQHMGKANRPITMQGKPNAVGKQPKPNAVGKHENPDFPTLKKP
jgi:hypothetical protein